MRKESAFRIRLTNQRVFFFLGGNTESGLPTAMHLEQVTITETPPESSLWSAVQRIVFVAFRWLIETAFVLASKLRTPRPLPPAQDPLLSVPAQVLAARIRKRQVKSEDVVKAYVARIREVNPLLNAVVDERFERALEEARRVDEFVASGKKTTEEMERTTPLLGIPFTVKESFQVEGLRQTVGLVSRKDSTSTSDARAVALLREAGAIAVAATNIPELCSSWETYNKVYGRTNNPYDTRRTAGGSTGGEASLIAASGSLFGIGSDIAGSIRIPAMFNGIFGHKPTRGIVSNVGGKPDFAGELQQYLVVGPMCRVAGDLLLVLKVLAGPKAHKLNLDQPVNVGQIKWFYMESIDEIPYVSNVVPEITTRIAEVLDQLEKRRGIKVQRIRIPEMNKSIDIYMKLFWGHRTVTYLEEMTDFKGRVNLWLEWLKWIFCGSSHTFATLLAAVYERRHPPSREALEAAEEDRGRLESQLRVLLGSDGVLLCPTHPTPALLHSCSTLRLYDLAYAAAFNVLGFPATHCPLGLGASSALPVGVQIVAAPLNDRLCLAAANELGDIYRAQTEHKPQSMTNGSV